MTHSILPQVNNTPSSPPILQKCDEAVAVSSSLIPLNEARNLSSFDLVLQKSASIQRTTSSTSKQHPNSIQGVNHKARCTSNSSMNGARTEHQNIVSSPPRFEAFARSIYRSVGQQQDLENQSISGFARAINGSSTHSRIEEHRFTIDEQVELETTSKKGGSLLAENSDGYVRSAFGGLFDSESGFSFVPMTSENYSDSWCPYNLDERHSDGSDQRCNIKGQKDCHFDLTEQAVSEPFITSNLGNFGSTAFSFATRPGDDGEPWLGQMISSNSNAHYSDFVFGVAPQICPRDSAKHSSQTSLAHDLMESGMLGYWKSPVVAEATGNISPHMPSGRIEMFASPLQSQSSRRERASAPLRSSQQSIVGLKRKADALSETAYSVKRSSNFFQPLAKHWPMHENFSEAMLWEHTPRNNLKTGNRTHGAEQNHVTECRYPAWSDQGSR
ncbi:hypothetical protein LTR84_004969 [Exophiala bonariae]|uniref:Uncharacterized protein n=1 Tax=Exophiala bonariae TaxID=1690606 RepID=A0AAV9NPC8_9EURO|nr:hypothetical protein LTR84_004969 [Exophiala bonariae]